MTGPDKIACHCFKCRGEKNYQLKTLRKHLKEDLASLQAFKDTVEHQTLKAVYIHHIQMNEGAIHAEENKKKKKSQGRGAPSSRSKSCVDAEPANVDADDELDAGDEFVDEMDIEFDVNHMDVNQILDDTCDPIEMHVFDDSASDISEDFACQWYNSKSMDDIDIDIDISAGATVNFDQDDESLDSYDLENNNGGSDEDQKDEPLPDIVVKLREEFRRGYTCPEEPPTYDPRPHNLTKEEEISLAHYIGWWKTNSTVEAYQYYADLITHITGIPILSLYKVRQLAESLVNFRVIMVDMCPSSCAAYTGPYAHSMHCTQETKKKDGPCMEPRYRTVNRQKPSPRYQFAVLPVMATIRALFANEDTSKNMRYRDNCLKEALHLIGTARQCYKDFPNSDVHATHYKRMGLFKDRRDVALAISSDGAQLTMKRQSNVWVAILILLNLPPDIRYKSSNVIITLVIPGPNSPQNLDSFLYPLFQEMAQASEGIWVWDAVDDAFFKIRACITMALGDMLGSAKLNGMAGHTANYGDRFSHVQGAKTTEKGARRIYYPLRPPEAEKYNENRPVYNIDKLPLRNQKNYWDSIIMLDNATTDALRTRITQQTGISRLTLCAASPAFQHPSFFPFDPFHLFYENCMPFFWDLWAKLTSEDELVHIDKSYLQMFGEDIPRAMTTLPPSFCGPVRDVYLKNQSQYKIYEWMALLHWYLVPMMYEADPNLAAIRNFAEFVYIVEYTMTVAERSETDLQNLHSIIAHFLTEFERIYVNNNPKYVSRCRLCVFQLIHIPAHIRWNGSVRLGSQATVERTIGELGHRVRSRKAPFANLTRLVKEKELVKILTLYYPQLTSFSSPPNPASSQNPSSLFSRQPPSPKKKLKGDSAHKQLEAELSAIAKWLGSPSLSLDNYQRWGKLRLNNGYVLRSSLVEVPENPVKRHYRWFKARGLLNFGEAYAFYSLNYRGENKELVVYKPLREIEQHFGVTIRGRWNEKDELHVLEISQILTIVGLWRVPNRDYVYVLQKHPGLEMLMQHMPDTAEAEFEIDTEEPQLASQGDV